MPQVAVRLIPKEGAPKERCKPIADRLLKAFQGEREPSGAVEVTVIVAPGHPDAEEQVDRVAREADEDWRDYYERGSHTS
jgi:hypothetical protein